MQKLGSASFETDGIRQDVIEMYGYEEKDGGFYPQVSGEDGRLHIVFEMGEN